MKHVKIISFIGWLVAKMDGYNSIKIDQKLHIHLTHQRQVFRDRWHSVQRSTAPWGSTPEYSLAKKLGNLTYLEKQKSSPVQPQKTHLPTYQIQTKVNNEIRASMRIWQPVKGHWQPCRDTGSSMTFKLHLHSLSLHLTLLVDNERAPDVPGWVC